MQAKSGFFAVVKTFLRNTSGAAAVEYGVIIMAMFGAIIPAFLYVSTGITVKFQSITNYFESLV